MLFFSFPGLLNIPRKEVKIAYIYRNSSSSNNYTSIRFTLILIIFGTSCCLVGLIVSRNYNRGSIDLLRDKRMIIVCVIKRFCLLLQCIKYLIVYYVHRMKRVPEHNTKQTRNNRGIPLLQSAVTIKELKHATEHYPCVIIKMYKGKRPLQVDHY